MHIRWTKIVQSLKQCRTFRTFRTVKIITVCVADGVSVVGESLQRASSFGLQLGDCTQYPLILVL